MRPYMLWLTRVYALGRHTKETTNWFWTMGVGDWLKRQGQAVYQDAYARRFGQRSKYPSPNHGLRTSMSIGSRLRVASQREANRRARAAGQGGR